MNKPELDPRVLGTRLAHLKRRIVVCWRIAILKYERNNKSLHSKNEWGSFETTFADISLTVFTLRKNIEKNRKISFMYIIEIDFQCMYYNKVLGECIPFTHNISHKNNQIIINVLNTALLGRI